MPFIDINEFRPVEISPGVRIRTPHLNNLMLSYLEMDEGTAVPLHKHPHEQGGILLAPRSCSRHFFGGDRATAPRCGALKAHDGSSDTRRECCARCYRYVIIRT